MNLCQYSGPPPLGDILLPGPILRISFRYLRFFAGIVEMVVSAICLLTANCNLGLGLGIFLVVAGTTFSSYGTVFIGLAETRSNFEKGMVVLLRYDNSKGPAGETHQLLVFREDLTGFQCLRRWISAEEFESRKCVESAKNPLYFDEVLSAYGNHVFKAIFSGQNLLEYQTELPNVEEESIATGKHNMLVKNYSNEHRLYSVLCGTGIPSVTNVVGSLDDEKFLVGTYTSPNAVMTSHTEPASGLRSFQLYNKNGLVVQRSEYRTLSNGDDFRKPVCELKTEKLSADGNSWMPFLQAQFFRLDEEFPSLAQLHQNTYGSATGPARFQNWHVITNHGILAVAKSGQLKPFVKPLPGRNSSLLGSKAKVVRVAIMITFLLGLIALIRIGLFRKPQSKNTKK